MAIITLTTDFGTKDHFVAAMKGRILKEVPGTVIVDISHKVSPFDVQECAHILKNCYHEFPEGSIHIIGLESEISVENEHLVGHINGHFFIGANNGVLSLINKGVKDSIIQRINLPNSVKTAFPELEIFTKVACHLARGGTLEVVGKPFDNLKEIKIVEPRITEGASSIIGNVTYIDHYGNVVTNISKALFEAYRNGRSFEILARTEKTTSIFQSYNELIDYDLPKNQRKGPSDFLAIFNASGYIELAIYKSDLKTVGGASSLIGLNRGDVITINFL